MIENLRDNAGYAAQASHELSDIRIGQLTDIACDTNHAATLMQRYHSKTRNMVRKAEKQGFGVSIENDAFDFLYNTHLENMQVIGGTAKSPAFFEAVAKHFVAGKDYNIWVARHNNVPIAAMLLFYFSDMVEYFTPVIVEQWREAQPLSLLIYHAMIAASQAGYKQWNWGGTWVNQEGVYHFKKRWGAEDRRYHYYTHIQNPALYTTTPAELLQHYPGFFMLPFSALKTLASA
jgi:lipid II:glycine glycyltransferase (peptidoglycan interpeptide bridge formation enzyme)